MEEAGEGGEGALCVSLSLRASALGTCISLHRLGVQEVGGCGARRKDANINICLFVFSFVICFVSKLPLPVVEIFSKVH